MAAEDAGDDVSEITGPSNGTLGRALSRSCFPPWLCSSRSAIADAATERELARRRLSIEAA